MGGLAIGIRELTATLDYTEAVVARLQAVEGIVTAARDCIDEQRTREGMERHPEDWHRVWSLLRDAVDAFETRS